LAQTSRSSVVTRAQALAHPLTERFERAGRFGRHLSVGRRLRGVRGRLERVHVPSLGAGLRRANTGRGVPKEGYFASGPTQDRRGLSAQEAFRAPFRRVEPRSLQLSALSDVFKVSRRLWGSDRQKGWHLFGTYARAPRVVTLRCVIGAFCRSFGWSGSCPALAGVVGCRARMRD